MHPQLPAKQPRKFYLDVARVVAIISISLNHAVNRSYANYSGQMEEFYSISLASTLFKTVCAVFSRMGVPLFLMITGVLILNKKIENQSDIKKFYKHNLLSLFITTEIWYALMYWFIVLFKSANTILETEGFFGAILGMLETMLFQNQLTFGSMWYMPLILCLYATLPFVVIVKDKLSGERLSPILFLPAIILFVTNMILPALNSFLYMLGVDGFSSEISGSYLFSEYYLYIIIGYLVGQGVLNRFRTRTVALVTGLTFVICCAYQFYAYAQPLNYQVAYDFPLMPFCVGFLFEFIRRTAKYLRKCRKPITYLSRISFGIYFMHIVIMTILVSLTKDIFIAQPLRLLFYEIVSVGGSIALIIPLSKIPFCKKYLFLIK